MKEHKELLIECRKEFEKTVFLTNQLFRITCQLNQLRSDLSDAYDRQCELRGRIEDLLVEDKLED